MEDAANCASSRPLDIYRSDQCGAGVAAVVFLTTGCAGLVVEGSGPPPDGEPELEPVARVITSEVAVEGADETVVTNSESTFLVVTTSAGGTYQLLSPASRK